MTEKKCRAVELDVWRGVAVFNMLLYHLLFDWYEIFGLSAFAWFKSDWFFHPMRAFTIPIFLIVAGISCLFSRSNGKRALRMGLIALLLTAATVCVSMWTGQPYYMFWQVIHLLAACVLTVYLLEKFVRSLFMRYFIYLLLIVFFLSLAPLLSELYHWDVSAPVWLLPLGAGSAHAPAMLDYMPLIPWAGYFFIGALIGPLLYPEGRVERPRLTAGVFKPFAFLGSHALLIYALHQPVMIGLTAGVLKLLGIR